MGKTYFIGSNIYRGSRYGRLHPLSIERVPAVIDLGRALGWLPESQYRTSPRAKPAALTAFHTPDYVDALMRAEARQTVPPEERQTYGLGTLSNPVCPEMYRRPATAAGGGLLAAELVAQGGVVHNPGGGTHHGFPGRAAGFCYLNEPVLTIRRLLAMGLTRILYVDIDAHHGDGVEAAFAGSEMVRMISLHEENRWPFTGKLEEDGQGAALNLPLPRGAHDGDFEHALEELILPLADAFRPEAIFLQCGADAVLEDPLSRLAMSNNAHFRAAAALRPLSPRLIVSGGGGYNPWTVARLWTGIWATLSVREIPDHLPAEARAVLEALSWSRTGKPSEALLSTMRDVPRHGPASQEVRERVAALRRRI